MPGHSLGARPRREALNEDEITNDLTAATIQATVMQHEDAENPKYEHESPQVGGTRTALKKALLPCMLVYFI